jgi:SAM-dependent methyltransferase
VVGVARYDGLAEWYDRQFPSAFGDAVAGAAAELLGGGDGACLDIGCGTGRYFEVLASLGWSVVGLDGSSDQLSLAAPRGDALGARVVVGDATALPFSAETFDAAVALMISTDVEPYERVVAEAARVLRPGGVFVHVGAHPCFVGPHSLLHDERRRLVGPGYRERGYKASSPAFHPTGIRVKVGAVHIPLDDLLNAVVGAGLRVERVLERYETSEAPPAILGLRARKDRA